MQEGRLSPLAVPVHLPLELCESVRAVLGVTNEELLTEGHEHIASRLWVDPERLPQLRIAFAGWARHFDPSPSVTRALAAIAGAHDTERLVVLAEPYAYIYDEPVEPLVSARCEEPDMDSGTSLATFCEE